MSFILKAETDIFVSSIINFKCITLILKTFAHKLINEFHKNTNTHTHIHTHIPDCE